LPRHSIRPHDSGSAEDVNRLLPRPVLSAPRVRHGLITQQRLQIVETGGPRPLVPGDRLRPPVVVAEAAVAHANVGADGSWAECDGYVGWRWRRVPVVHDRAQNVWPPPGESQVVAWGDGRDAATDGVVALRCVGLPEQLVSPAPLRGDLGPCREPNPGLRRLNKCPPKRSGSAGRFRCISNWQVVVSLVVIGHCLVLVPATGHRRRY